MKVPEEGLRPLLEVSKRSIRKYFKHDNMSSHAAALAYRALFALVPFLALLVALAWFLGIGNFFTQWLSDQTSSALLGQNRRACGRMDQAEPGSDSGRAALNWHRYHQHCHLVCLLWRPDADQSPKRRPRSRGVPPRLEALWALVLLRFGACDHGDPRDSPAADRTAGG